MHIYQRPVLKVAIREVLMQLISLQQRNLCKTPSSVHHLVIEPEGGDDHDPPPSGGVAIHLRDLRFDPPVIVDALARWAA